MCICCEPSPDAHRRATLFVVPPGGRIAHSEMTVRRALLVVLVLVLAFLAATPWLADPALRFALRALATEDLDYDRLRVGLQASELGDVTIGRDQPIRIAHLRIEHGMGDLRAWRAGTITLSGLELPATFDEEGFRVPALPAGEPGEPVRLPAIPAERVVVVDSRLALTTPAGRLDLPLAGELSIDGERLALSVAVAGGRLVDGIGELALDADLRASAPAGEALDLGRIVGEGNLELAAGGLAWPGLVDGLGAALGGRLATTDAGLTLVLDHARIEAEDLQLDALGLYGPARLHLADDERRLAIEAVMVEDGVDLHATGAGWLDSAALQLGLALDGQISLAADGTPRRNGEGQTVAEISAIGDVALDDLQPAGFPGRIGGGGEFTLALLGETLRLDLADFALTLDPNPGLLPIAGPLRLAVRDRRDLHVRAALGETPTSIELDGPLRLEGEGLDLALDLDAAMTADASAPSVTRAEAAIRADMLAWDGLDLGGSRAVVTGSGDSDRASATLDLALAIVGRPLQQAEIADGRVTALIAADLTADRVVLRLREDAVLEAERVAWANVASAPLRAQVIATDAPFATLALGLPDGPAVTLDARLASVPLDVTLRMPDQPPRRLRGSVDEARITLAGVGADFAGEVLIDGGEIRLDDPALTLEGLHGTAAFDQDGLADADLPLRIDAIRHTGEPAWFRSLALNGRLIPTPEAIGFDLRLTGAGGAFDLHLVGDHDPVSGRGASRVTLTPLTLAPGALTPAAISPLLAPHVQQVSGTVALDGRAAWGPQDPASELDLLLRDLSFTTGAARIERANGVIRIDRLAPPRTPPDQRLAIAMFDIGLPLTDGLLAGRLVGDGSLWMSDVGFRFADGLVRARPFSLRSGQTSLSVVLEAQDLDLAALARIVELDGLAGEGRMAGRLPLVIEDGVVRITGGVLEASPPGWVRYRPSDPPAAFAAGGEGVGIMLSALENFRYDVLRVTLDGRTDEEMDIGLALHGRNPDLYDGHPVEFNLNVEGELANIFTRTLEVYTLPDMVRQRLERFGR